jgi:hypothetical protein
MLSERFAIHSANCHGFCAPGECIQDVEKLAQSVLLAHERAGVKRNGRLDRPGMTLSESDREDLLSFLVATAWEASQRFHPNDDGRGTNRLAGYVVWTLHRRLVDWVRQRFGSTRYPNSRIVATLVPLTPAIEERMTPFLDPELGDSDALDLEAAPAGTAAALALLQPWLDGEVGTVAQAAELAHVKPYQVTNAFALVRAAARQQGLEPGGEERHALADRAAGLRKQRLTYGQIADELSLHSSHTASALIRDYHPELIQKPSHGRSRLSANEHRPHSESLSGTPTKGSHMAQPPAKPKPRITVHPPGKTIHGPAPKPVLPK